LAAGWLKHGADWPSPTGMRPPPTAAAPVSGFGCRTLARTVDVTDEASWGLAAELTASWVAWTPRQMQRERPLGRPRSRCLSRRFAGHGVNITGTFICCRVFGKAMAERGGGKIVNISQSGPGMAPGRYGRLLREQGAVDALTAGTGR